MSSVRLLALLVLVVGALSENCSLKLVHESSLGVDHVAVDSEEPLAIATGGGKLSIMRNIREDGKMVVTVTVGIPHGAYASSYRRSLRNATVYFNVWKHSNESAKFLVGDVRDPHNVRWKEVGKKGPGVTTNLEVVGSRLYVSYNQEPCLEVYDISAPFSPVLVASHRGVCEIGTSFATKVLEGFEKETLFVLNYENSRAGVYEVATDTFTEFTNLGSGGWSYVANHGKMVYLKGKLIDLSGGISPTPPVSQVDHGVFLVEGNHMYAFGADDEAVLVLDVRDKTPLEKWERVGVAAQGDLVVTGNGRGVRVHRWECNEGVELQVDGKWVPVAESFGDAKPTYPHLTESRGYVLESLPPALQIRVTCNTACEVYVSIKHCPPCTTANNGSFPALMSSSGWEAKKCGADLRGEEEKASFRKVLPRQGSVVTPAMTHAAGRVVVVVARVSKTCRALATHSACASSSELCRWTDGSCTRRWCPTEEYSKPPCVCS